MKFFEVHMEADEWHTQECADLLEKISKKDQDLAQQGAVRGAKLLWQFLDEMQQVHLQNDLKIH